MAIRMNPINYNFWMIRREILRKINYDPHRELLWVEEIIVENPKNFLSWNHRRIIANLNLACVSSSIELKLTDQVLQRDAKNYFAYSHRQWSINTFKFENLGLLKEEMKFTTKLIEMDIRNNSAWNQRFFVMKQLGKFDFVLVKSEFNFSLKNIKKVNCNESAWNYLRGLLENFGTKKLYQFNEIKDYCEHELVEKKNCNPLLIAFYIELKIEMILDDVISDSILNSQKVYELCNDMATRYDKFRKNYWKFVHKKFFYDKIMKRKEKFGDDSKGGIGEDETWKTKICKVLKNE